MKFSDFGILFLFLAFFKIGCTTTPLQDELETLQKSETNTESLIPKCESNDPDDNCQIKLDSIYVEFTDLACTPYTYVLDVITPFYAPASIKDGSIAFLEWEFLPNGNAGFWTANIATNSEPHHSGKIIMTGCFSYGDQHTLRILRSIKDHNGFESNSIVIEIPKPESTKSTNEAFNGFKFEFLEVKEIKSS
jgi:hypothetical protein